MNRTKLFDLAIVGAGPAGLFAAQEMVRLRPQTAMVILDRGRDLHERSEQELKVSRSEDWLSGFGGAGFFIGGRMSLDEGLSGRPRNMDGAKSMVIAEGINRLLTSWGCQSSIQDDPPEPLQEASRRARDAGLNWHRNYPARHLSLEERLASLRSIDSILTGNGSRAIMRTEVTAIEREGDVWRVEAVGDSHRTDTYASHLLLAPGRSGAEDLARILGRAGLDPRREQSVGVRVEVPSRVLEPLLSVSPDPRLSLDLPQGRFRTYAFTRGGRIVVEERGQTLRIGVRPTGRSASESSSFSVLWQSGQTMGDSGMREASMMYLSDLEGFSLGRRSIQPYVPPSLELTRGDVLSHWPPEFWSGLSEFLTRMSALVPELRHQDGFIYSPALETVWLYDVDSEGRTSLPSLYVAGDGPGLSQGAMAAAIGGVAAARAIAASL